MEQRMITERLHVRPSKDARERSEKSDRQVRVRPPRQDAAIDQECPISVADEIVQIKRTSW
jgi:hypothetical protein